jgi:CarboxypepD_reg-like domain
LQFVLLFAETKMKSFAWYIKILAAIVLLSIAKTADAQYKIQGTVYDSSHLYPLEAVSVLATNGNGAVTNADGQYSIEVGEKDSIWFSYLGKPTIKFPVLKITDVQHFEIALRVNVSILKEVTIRNRNYKEDSAQNRKDYAKVFDFRRPNLGTMTSIGPSGAGIDINELIRTFQFRKNRNMERFQERLMQQEKDKFIDHRFNKALVRRLTNLPDDQLDRFMVIYRPDYEFALYSSDYDFQSYIKEAHAIYNKQKAF